MTLNHETFLAISMAGRKLRSRNMFPAEGYDRFGSEWAAALTKFFQAETAARGVTCRARRLDRLGTCVGECLVTIGRDGELTEEAAP